MARSQADAPFRKSFVWGAIWGALLTIVALQVRKDASLDEICEMLAGTMLAAAITGCIAQRGRDPWSFAKVGAWYPAVLVGLAMMERLGSASAP